MRIVVLLLALCLAGCSARHKVSPGLNYEIGPECNPVIHLMGCDKASPPHCKKALTTYVKGCEKIVSK